MQVAAIRHSVDGWQRRRAFAAFPVAVARKFVDDRAGGFAALIAYYAFFSIFPVRAHQGSVHSRSEDGCDEEVDAAGSEEPRPALGLS